MNSRFMRILSVPLTFLGLLVSVGQAESRTTICLDGTWKFATDPDDRGEAEQWFLPSATLPKMPLPGYAPTADGTIRVPGIWDNQGYGTETDCVRHNFIGKGWYKREVKIPGDWAGRKVFLVVTGVNRYAKAWVNDHYLGEHIGARSVCEYDITKYVSLGKTATLTIQVDSKPRWKIDTMCGCSFLIDYMDTHWGGIWGHVRLEARSDAWLSDLFVEPNVAESSCTASATLNGDAALADGVRLEVFDASGTRVAEATSKPSRVTAAIPDAKLWTPDSPTLYTARLSLLKGDETFDTIESRFGMRQFTINGPYFLLNGKRIMLRGYGDDHIYPEQMAMPSDKELHLKRLRLIKSYGFNHVRHHSTMMPPEYYDACDEVGMICTAEFSTAYYRFLPAGEFWQELFPSGVDSGPVIETHKREWEAAIIQHRNHPSIMSWVMGNELAYAGHVPVFMSLGREFRRIAQQYDPTRFFADADGGDEVEALAPHGERDTLAYYTPGLKVLSDPMTKVAVFQPPTPSKPVIAHEAGNFTTFSRPDLADQFKHNIKPYWLTASKAKLEELGLLEESFGWAEKSERMYLLCHKYNIEAIRKNPYISGYHWWLFQDYWTSSNGLVDHYFRQKKIAPAEVLRFNNEVVPLQEGLSRTYRGKSRMDVKLLISNFAPDPLDGQLVWKVAAGGKLLADGESFLTSLPESYVSQVGQIGVDLPDLEGPTLLKVFVEVVSEGRRFQNDWSAWLYPSEIKPEMLSVPVFADETILRQYPGWGLQPIPAEGALDAEAVYVLGRVFDARVVDALDRGASVVLLDGEDCTLGARSIVFRTDWWRGGYEHSQGNHGGTIVYDHPVTRAMAPDGWCDAGWYDLLMGARKYSLGDAPARPDVIVRAIPSMTLVEDEALVYEVGVGKGCLIVSGLNHDRAAGTPENDWLVARLLDRAAARLQPKARWPVSFLAAATRRVSGFQRLLANEGDDAERLSYREDKAPIHLCHQTKPGNLVAWETASVPADLSDDSVTFVFAGGLGSPSHPERKGFALDITGRQTLQFDTEPCPSDGWQSPDKRVTLRFFVLHSTCNESGYWYDPLGMNLGLFYLTVPRDMLEPGKPCRLGVRSLGSDSERWFGLNPYTDVR